MATSGEASVRACPPALDSAMVKPVPPTGSSGVSSTAVTIASGGASARSQRPNSRTASAGPSASITTPSAVFATDPARARSAAVA
nr:hypothetical protein GCM10020092_082460 [Actinoplanes digitatis]